MKNFKNFLSNSWSNNPEFPGPDFGTQYRSEIFYLNDNQKKIAEKVHKDINERLSGKVVTKISLLKNYCPAEEYHQKYLEKDKNVIGRDRLVTKNINNVKIIDCFGTCPKQKEMV